jgi:hypothetical protein
MNNIWEKAIPNWKKRATIDAILKIMKQDKENPFAESGWDVEIVYKNKLTLLGFSHDLLVVIKEKIKGEKLLDQYIKDFMSVFWKLREQYPDKN